MLAFLSLVRPCPWSALLFASASAFLTTRIFSSSPRALTGTAHGVLIEVAAAAVEDGYDMRPVQETFGHKNLQTRGAHDIGNY